MAACASMYILGRKIRIGVFLWYTRIVPNDCNTIFLILEHSTNIFDRIKIANNGMNETIHWFKRSRSVTIPSLPRLSFICIKNMKIYIYK